MRWPWQRRGGRVAGHTDRAELDAQRRLRQAHWDSEAIDARAAELVRDLPAGELYLRVARALNRDPRSAG
jgi:hypothetical protein